MLSAEEKAQQQADKVLTWIRFHAGKPQAKRTPVLAPAPAEAAPAAAQAKVAGKPANKTAVAVLAPAATPLTAQPSAALPEPAGSLAQSALLAAASMVAPAMLPEVLPERPQRPLAVAPAEAAPLKLIHKVEPEIPRQLRADFRGGSVTMKFVVQKDGSVDQAVALQSTHKRLAAAAVAALSQWRFEPLSAPREATVELGFSIE